jgi:hypothetical protein
MTVYVDDMFQYPMGEFRGMKMSHMIGDTADELHALADAIGLARKHYQGDHYDVSMSLRRKAIAKGAIAITLRELAHISKERRAMGRKPSAKKASNKAVSGLLEALRFIEPSQSEIGQLPQTHCMFANHWATAFNGLIMMATHIDTDIVAFPNTKRLIKVLMNCDETTQITQLDSGRLGIKSGKFQAYVPCIDGNLLAFTPPDPPQYQLNDAVLSSLGIVGIVAKENAPRVVQASVLLRQNSAAATDGVMALEHWHGTPMPTVCLPKVFITELMKIKKKPASLGASQNTCTVYFDDGSFIRTQLYTEPYPDIDRVLNTPNTPMPLPEDFFKAVRKIESNKEESGSVYFNGTGSKLQTGPDDNVGASFDYEHPLPHGILFNIELLLRFAPHAKQADFVAGPKQDMAIFYGDNFRGVLMQKIANPNAVIQNAPAPEAPPQSYGYGAPSYGAPANVSDDTIPF